MDYTKYNVEDFASDNSFINWVNRKDPEAGKFWVTFVVEHPELKVKIEQARTLVLNLKRSQDILVQKDQINLLWERIAEQVTEPELVVNESVSKYRTLLKFAAVLLFIVSSVALGYFLIQPNDLFTNSGLTLAGIPEDFIEEINTTDHVIKLHLNDGSVVSLERNSRLSYKKDYNGDSSRHVYLTGEAFFDVAKNPFKPFLVHSNEVITEVLGTSFRVQAGSHDKNIVVSVKTGRVSVYSLAKINSPSDRERNGVILLPNQQVLYRREQQSFDKKLIDSPEILTSAVKINDFNFDNTPARNVFKSLQNAYGIEIIFNDDSMKNCFITAPLGSEPLFEKLQIICRTIGASYEIVDAKVIISSAGC